MTNPFKVGDKVVRKPEWPRGTWARDGEVCIVEEADYYGDGSPCIRLQGVGSTWDAIRFRAAIAGQDYPAPGSNGPLEYAPNTGQSARRQQRAEAQRWPAIPVRHRNA